MNSFYFVVWSLRSRLLGLILLLIFYQDRGLLLTAHFLRLVGWLEAGGTLRLASGLRETGFA